MGKTAGMSQKTKRCIGQPMPFDFALQKLAFMPSNSRYCFCSEKSLNYPGFTVSLKQE
jgi:hypothetical protein